MAERITDKKKKKIIADYLRLGNYSATARANGVSDDSVKRIVLKCDDFTEKEKRKKEQDTADILAYMEAQRGMVCEIISKGLQALNEPGKLADASPAQITTAIGTLIDKWAAISGAPGDTAKEDDLSRSLKELAKEMEDGG